MEAFQSSLSVKINNVGTSVSKTDQLIKDLESNLQKYVDKARNTLKKKLVINPKPQKRLMRVIAESEGSEEESATSEVAQQQKSPQRDSLRPIRTAKTNASKHLKEASTGIKLRNDNNVAVFVKTERVSTASNKKKRDSAKENAKPNDQKNHSSVDEGIQRETDGDKHNKRSQSVELIPTKPVQIDITDDKDSEKMPPPAMLVKKKKVQKQSVQELPLDPTQAIPVRMTRSKIKKEKPSIEKTASLKDFGTRKSAEAENEQLQKSASESVLTLANETAKSKKGKKKNPVPIPFVIKVEKLSIDAAVAVEEQTKRNSENKSRKQSNEIPPKEPNVNETATISCNPVNETATINCNPVNETVTIASNVLMNETVTLSNNIANETYNKNTHDSLMTEDNDEENSVENLPQLKEKFFNPPPPPLPLKLKKNEVFNPYLSSPVKQRVQAFEKHGILTPDKSKATYSKYSTLKSGTPSKIALYGTKTTPLNSAKQKYIAAVTGSSSSSSSSQSGNKKLSKKFTSVSQDSNEDLRKIQAQAVNQQLEEKKRQREEKQRQVQLQREAIEKQKREQTLQQQRERDEKYRKIMQEKEDAKKMEVFKKKQYKENQEKKFAEEKARKNDNVKEPQSASKDDSLHIKMQRQILLEKTLSQTKKLDKKTYSFDMLLTDDSTDDESKPSKKRPSPPEWSKKQNRKSQIYLQSFANAHVLDAMFSSQPINVDLKEIFPKIDVRKLVRNSSAVWKTPPRYSQLPKH